MKRISLLLLALSTICLTGCSFTQQHEKDQFSKISECKKLQDKYYEGALPGQQYRVYYSKKTDYCVLEQKMFYGEGTGAYTTYDLIDLAGDKSLAYKNTGCRWYNTEEECKNETLNYERIGEEYLDRK